MNARTDLPRDTKPFTRLPVSVATRAASACLDLSGVTNNRHREDWAQTCEGRTHRLLQYQHQYAPYKSLRYCSRASVPGKNPIYSDKGIRNLITCKSSMCVRCGRGKSEQNAAFVERVIKKTKDKYSYFLGTLTLSTDTDGVEQTTALQGAYRKFINNVRTSLKKQNVTFSCAWTNDATFCVSTGKSHFHRHYVCRVEREYEGDLKEKLWSCWSRAVRTYTDRSVDKKAFYCEPIKTAKGSSKYLYKAVREGSVMTNKNITGTRLSLMGLLEHIGQGANHLVSIYKKAVESMRGRRWFGMPVSWKIDDYTIPEIEEEKTLLELEEEKRIIKPIEGTPQIHSAILEAGAYSTLMYVLKTKQDGDEEVETFRALVEKWKVILYRGNKKTALIHDASKEFYSWAEDIGIW